MNNIYKFMSSQTSLQKTLSHYLNSNKGFTLMEIVIVVFLIGVVVVPFSNMFIFGVKGTITNTDHVIAYNLAREKIEEIKGLPFSIIKSDYENFREVYQDRPGYDDAYYSEDSFINYFTDVYSESSFTKNSITATYNKLKELYPKTYLKELSLYPDEYSKYRRVAKVEEIIEAATAPKLKKVSVLVFNDKNLKIAELRTYIGKQK